jgi:hypothetical protein
MRNEFAGTTGWGCPCASQPGGCGGECSLSGDDVLSYYEIMDVSTALAMASHPAAGGDQPAEWPPACSSVARLLLSLL